MASTVLPAIYEEPASSSATAPALSVDVKLSLRGETYHVAFPIEKLSWDALKAKVHDCYDDANRPAFWTLGCRDNEDDLVTVTSEREFLEAFRVFTELKEQTIMISGEREVRMHFHVVVKLSLKEQLAPVMQAVNDISEKVGRLATDTRDSLRKSSYVERGRESLYYSAARTRDVLSSGGRGFSQRVRRASTEISDLPRRLRPRSRVSSQDARDSTSPQALMVVDVERETMGDDVSTEMDVADLLAQARAAEAEAERNAVAIQQDEAEPATNADAQVEAEETNGHTSDAETASTASESEWDFVRSSPSSSGSVARSVSPFLTVEADDEVEVSFTRWATQVAMIRDIMPQIDSGICVGVLDKHNGDLEAALVELTEL